MRALITQRETQRGEQAARSVGRETSMEDPAQRPVRPRGLVGEEGEEEGGGRKQVMCEQRSAQMEETRPSLERPPPGVQHTGFLRVSFASAFSTFFHNKCIHFIIFIRKKHKSSVKFQYLKQCSSDSKKKRTHESIKQILDNAILDLILCTHCVHTSVASSDRMVTFVKKK